MDFQLFTHPKHCSLFSSHFLFACGMQSLKCRIIYTSLTAWFRVNPYLDVEQVIRLF